MYDKGSYFLVSHFLGWGAVGGQGGVGEGGGRVGVGGGGGRGGGVGQGGLYVFYVLMCFLSQQEEQ